MPIVTVTYKGNKPELLYDIYAVKEKLESKSIYIGVYEETDDKFNIIKIFSSKEVITNKEINIIYTNITEVIYKAIMLEFYNKNMDDVISNNYFFLTEDEANDIKVKLFSIIIDYSNISDENQVYCINRINEIKENILQVLVESKKINISGYLRFRLGKITNKVKLIIDKLIERTMIEKEYDEFIKLLKYFIEMQDSKIDILHILIDKEGTYNVVDDDENDLLEEFKGRSHLDFKDHGVCIEDIIISGLVINSPKKIMLHGENNCTNSEFINTIKSVFDDRVESCKGCERCSNILNKN